MSAVRGHPTRKLKIKQLRTPNAAVDFAGKWQKLRDAVEAIRSSRKGNAGYEELYQDVESLCVAGDAVRTHAGILEELNAQAASQLALVAERVALEHHLFLTYLGRVWQEFCTQLLLIRQIFLYLDRTYALRSPDSSSLFEAGLQLFGTHLRAQPQVLQKLVDGLLFMVDAERTGEVADWQLAKRLLRMLSSLALYEHAFQRPFLERSERHYKAEGSQLVQECDAAAYAVHCERRLLEETSRCELYLEPSTRAPLVSLVESCLVQTHLGAMLECDFNRLLAQERIEDLGRLFRLATRVSMVASLRRTFLRSIQTWGIALVMNPEKDAELVELLLTTKAKLDRVVEHSFAGHEGFASAVREGFEGFVNQRANKPAELVAKHIDTLMKGSLTKHASEDELDSALDATLQLFRYIQGKDVFEAFYKKDLAKRLLLGRSASEEAERVCISRLKAECGSQFTNKLEGMLRDIEISQDIMAAFRQERRSPLGMDVHVQVLTSGFWPSYPMAKCNLPDEFLRSQQAFRDFYLAKHSGRQLVWHHSLGMCIMRARFQTASKELSTSLLQAVVLMLFNDADQLSLSDIQSCTALDVSELKRVLFSLANGRDRILVKQPKGKEVEHGDTFGFNAGYSSRLHRIRVNAVQMRETAEENKKTNEAVLQDRQYQIDAAIVRIMKTRKMLSHKLLMAELVSQLRFPVHAADLKKRIESLIDREYLERDAKDPQIFKYLA